MAGSSGDNDTTRAGDIKLFQVIEGKQGSRRFADLSLACVELSYYEDILSNSVSASAVIVESGLSDSNIGFGKNNTNAGYAGILDNLPVVGGEQVNLIFEDKQIDPTTLKFQASVGNELSVNRVRQINPGTQKSVYSLDLCTREFISNEQSRVVKRYNGTISDNVVEIIKGNLPSRGFDQGIFSMKEIEVDKTAVPYNFIGNDRKPFYVCTWLAAKSIPVLSVDGKEAIGGAAGYFFYETYDGFKFKAIDVLSKSSPKKTYIFNNVSKLPKGYDAKILDVNINSDVDLQQNLTMGAYANRTLFFDYVTMKYRVRDYKLSEDQKDKVENVGKKSFGEGISAEIKDAPSRIMNRVLDVGTLPLGVNAHDQLAAWKNNPDNPTFAAAETTAQAAMRYNQLFAIKIDITIAGDFSLRAGDLIHCDFSDLTVDRNKDTNVQTGGNYLIASVCHRVTPENCYSRLTLVRDSFGRAPIKISPSSEVPRDVSKVIGNEGRVVSRIPESLLGTNFL